MMFIAFGYSQFHFISSKFDPLCVSNNKKHGEFYLVLMLL